MQPELQSKGPSTQRSSAIMFRGLLWTLHAVHKRRGPGQARERALAPEAEAAVLAGLEDDAVGTPWRAQAAGTPAALAAAVRCAGAPPCNAAISLMHTYDNMRAQGACHVGRRMQALRIGAVT
jgi:hypothetical protein